MPVKYAAADIPPIKAPAPRISFQNPVCSRKILGTANPVPVARNNIGMIINSLFEILFKVPVRSEKAGRTKNHKILDISFEKKESLSIKEAIKDPMPAAVMKTTK